MLAFWNSQLPQRAEDAWYYKKAISWKEHVRFPLREVLLSLIRTFCDIHWLTLRSLNFLRYLQFLQRLKSAFSFEVLGFHQHTNECMQRIRWEDHPALGSCLFSMGICHQGIYPPLKKKAFLFFIHPLLISTCLSEWLMKEYESWVNFTLFRAPLKLVLKEGRVSRAAQAVLLDSDLTFNLWDFFFVFLGSAQVNSLNLSLTHTHTNTKRPPGLPLCHPIPS